MKVESVKSYNINDSNAKLFSEISIKNRLNNKKRIYFGQVSQIQNKVKEEKKSWGWKRITNVAGVTAGIAAIFIPILLNWRRPAVVKLAEQSKKLTAKLKALNGKAEAAINTATKATGDEAKSAINTATNNESKKNNLFKFGEFMNKTKENNEELINNIIYGIGTVVIMPLVILFSPIGKKKSTKEDKFFAVARQPLSFATMFSMQLTMDKVIKKIMPNIIKSNTFENDAVIKAAKTALEKGEALKASTLNKNLLNKIKYNDKILKEVFESTAEKLGIKKEEIKELFKLSENEIKKGFRDLIQKTLRSDQKEVAGLIERFNNKNYAQELKAKGLNRKEYKKAFSNKELSFTKELNKLIKKTKGTDKKIANTVKESIKFLDKYFIAKNTVKQATTSVTIAGNVIFSTIIGCTLLNVIYGKAMKAMRPQNAPEVSQDNMAKGGVK